jgi:hypothetical protein
MTVKEKGIRRMTSGMTVGARVRAQRGRVRWAERALPHNDVGIPGERVRPDVDDRRAPPLIQR